MSSQGCGGSTMSASASTSQLRLPGAGGRRSARRRRTVHGIGVALSALLTVTLLPGDVWGLPPADPRNGFALAELQQEESARLDEVKAEALGDWSGTPLEPPAEYNPTDTTAPAGGTASVPLPGTGGGDDLVQAGSLPVSIGQASPTETEPTPPPPSGTWDVALEPRTATEDAEVDGAIITVTPPSTGSTPVDVELDYGAFEDLYGTEWATRLHLVQLPECFLTTPELEECVTATEVPSENDPGGETVRATVDPSTAQPSGLSTQSGGGPVVLAATDSASGAGGTYKASSLSPSGTWTAGGSGGGFTWSYPLTVPSAPAGPAPAITFAYSSQAVDAKTSVANGQASWIGDGWNYQPGFVERRYRSCSQDRDGTPNNDNTTDKKKGDLCWAGDNVVMSLGGATTELVHDDATGKWIPANDDGAKVEHKTDTTPGNGDNDGEYWIVTTRDGTRHYFGRHDVDGAGTRPTTDSVFTAPVFGNHSGEPCHATAFADSSCTQAWRWNLDYVEDVHGNAMVIDWAKETNHYAKNKKFKSKVSYVRGGYPTKIEYGLRADNLTGPPAGKVTFSVAERCIVEGSVSCSDTEFESKNYADKQPWWDTPATLHCKSSATNCYVTSPTFWTRKRLASVTTWAQRTPGSTDLSKVDKWLLDQSFPKQRTDTHPPLWLETITRTGYGADGGSTTMPPVAFLPNAEDMPNRVATGTTDPTPDFDRLRVETIRTETGGETVVDYSAPCPVGGTHPAPEDNTTRCFPVPWSPDPDVETPGLEWFNKYVVDSVTEKDRVAQQPDVTTTYTYEGDAAWAKDTDEFSKPALRTYSQWRGYASVVVRTGETANTGGSDATVQTQTRSRYLRGMDDDPLPGGGQRSESVTVTDASGTAHTITDSPAFAGMGYESLTYTQSGGTVQARSITVPEAETTASRARAGLPDLKAYRTSVKQTDAVDTISNGRKRAVRTTTTYETTYGLPTAVQTTTLGPDVDASGVLIARPDKCATTSYVHNTTKHLIGLPSESGETVGSCADADSATGNEIISSSRTWYDTVATFGQTPTRGLARRNDAINGAGDGWVSLFSEYDAVGRTTKVTDAAGHTTLTEFTPATSTAFTVKVTNAAGHITSTTSDPGRSLPLSATDANGRKVRSQYDDLGRITAVWTPSRSTGDQSANMTFDYQIAANKPPAVTTRTLRDNGTYEDAVTLYDGLLRARQTQTEALGGGRVITDTLYNSSGAPRQQNNAYLAEGEPTGALFYPESVFQVPNSTETAYDGLGRAVQSTTFFAGTVQPDLTTRAEYAGDHTTAIPAKGGTPTRTHTDVLGHTTRIDYFTDAARTDAVSTTYEYDARGQQSKVTDQHGNTWTYSYDVRGRKIGSTDPDMGTSSFAFDNLDRQTRATDAKGTAHYTSYDDLGRKTAVRTGSATGPVVASWTYDTLPGAKGLPVASTRYQDGEAYTTEVTGYDTEYRPTGTKLTIPETPETTGLSGTYAYTFTYTATGKQQSVTLPATPGGLAAEKVITRYNGEGSPITTSGQSWYTADTVYSPFGEVLRTATGPAPSRVWTTNYFNENTGRLERTLADREKADPHRVSDTRYGYDPVGNITKLSHGRGTTTGTSWDVECFGYDGLARLVEAWTSVAGGSECQRGADGIGPDTSAVTDGPDNDGYWQSYTFDEIGNRTGLVDHDVTRAADGSLNTALDDTHEYAYGTTVPGSGGAPTLTQPHTLTQVDTTTNEPGSSVTSVDTYTHDTVGNTATRMLGGDTQTLAWTHDNKLASVDNTTDSTTEATYLYDADGNRLIQKTATGATLFLGEAEVTVDAAGTATDATRYYGHPGAPTVVRSTSGQSTGHTLTTQLTDHHATATTSVELAGTMAVERRKFDPYGNPRGTEPTAWAGHRTFLGTGIDDVTAGLTHIGAREYDPDVGRFLSVDPIMDVTDPQSLHGYAYAGNSPVTFSDPTGLCRADVCGVGVPIGGTDGKEFVTEAPARAGDISAGPSGGIGGTVTQSGTYTGTTVHPLAGGDVNNMATINERDYVQIYQDVWAPVDWDRLDEVAADFLKRIAAECQGHPAGINCVAERSESGRSLSIALAKFHACRGDCPPEFMSPGEVFGGGAWMLLGTGNGRGPRGGAPRSGGGCGHSFLEGTEVLLADGTRKNIEDVELGDEVTVTDPHMGETTTRKVTGTIFTEDDKDFVDLTVTTDDGPARLTATTTHPFWAPSADEWIDAGHLTPGTTLHTPEDGTVVIESVRPYAKRQRTHDLTITGIHTYYVLAGATPVLVHNSNCNSLTRAQSEDVASFLGYKKTKMKSAGGAPIWENKKAGAGQPRYVTYDRTGHNKQAVFKGASFRNPFQSTKDTARDGTYGLDVSLTGEVMGLKWLAK